MQLKSLRSIVWTGILLAAGTATAEFKIDRSVMDGRYWEVWNDAVQKRIDADIERYRKADAQVFIGVPDGTEVAVEQLTHAFFFGANSFNYNQLGKTEWNNRYKELFGTLFNSATVAFYWRTLERYPYAPRYAESYEDTEEYWNREYERDPAELLRKRHWRRPAPDPVIDFLRNRGVRIHGHPLVWSNNAWQTPTWLWEDFCPDAEKLALEQAFGVKIPMRDWKVPMGLKDFAHDADERLWPIAWGKIYDKLDKANLDERVLACLLPTYVKAQKEFFEKRIREIGERYGTRVDSWDVVNESATDWARYASRKWPKGESAAVNSLPLTTSWHGLLPANYAYEALVQARKYMKKDAWLNVNEWNMDAFPGQIADLNAHGADFDVVGSQMHLFNPKESARIAKGEFSEEVKAKISPEGIAKTFRRIMDAAGGRPIHLSEITITAPDATPAGEMVQAIIMRNCYRAWFAVEKMNGITWWNIVDGCGGPGEPKTSGLFTRDMRPKLAYYAMDDLINREWRTRLTAKVKGGNVSFRGFRGRYRLTWKDAAGQQQSCQVEVH